MLNRVINGYTIIACEHKPRWGYLIMGMRRQEDGTYTYVTAWMVDADLDVEWFWGNYGGTDFPDSIAGATDNFVSRLER